MRPGCARPPCSGGRSRGSPGTRSAPARERARSARRFRAWRAAPAGACGSDRNWLERRPQRARFGEMGAQARRGAPRSAARPRGEAHAVARHELEQAQHQFGLRHRAAAARGNGRARGHAEIGVGQARAPVAELREQGAGLGLAGLERAHGGAVDGAGVAVVFAHPAGRRRWTPVFGDGVLGVEGEHVVVAAGSGSADSSAGAPGSGRPRAARPGGLGAPPFAQLLQPADQLIIAQAAGRLLDVRLQVVESVGVLGVALARQLRQVADQRIAVARG